MHVTFQCHVMILFVKKKSSVNDPNSSPVLQNLPLRLN